MEFTLLGAAAIAVAALYATLYWEAKRGNAARCARNLWDIALTGVISGVLVGRLAAMVAEGVNPIAHPGDILIVRGGVATGPAVIGALAAVALLTGREALYAYDGLAAAGLAGLAGWHAGCAVRDACLGTPSGLPWALAQDGSTVTRHPVELYAAVLLIVAAAFVAWWKRTGRPPVGAPASFALASAGAIRLLTEPMRPTLSTSPMWWYALAASLGAAALMFSLVRSHAPQITDTG